MLDREGVAGPSDVALVGDEATVSSGIQRLAEAGATDFAAAVVGGADERDRTREVLSELARAGQSG
jgi:5,10-methylenetetrahydromethanopterin reductase